MRFKSSLWLVVGLFSLSFSIGLYAQTSFPIGNADLAGVDDPPQPVEPLPVEQAFVLSPPQLEQNAIQLSWQAAPDYYLYRDKITLRLLDAPATIQQGSLELPPGKTKQDEFFGTVTALYGNTTVRLPLNFMATPPTQLTVEASWQGCAEKLGVCYPPETQRFQIAANNAAISTQPLQASTPSTIALSEQDQLAESLKSKHLAWNLLVFFGLGLLLAFTPCVFPMIPILSGIIAGQKNLDTKGAFKLSLVYVLAMALTYTLVGILAGLFGANLQAWFQNTWVLVGFSLIFVLLALAMFGFYELQLPSQLQSRLTALSNQQSGGTLTGVAIMGVLSALIVGPCVAAPLAGALIYIGQTGNAVLGGAALFALSLGMGLPLILIGTSAGKFLPRAGAWMTVVRAAFGVLLLAVAIWLLERIVPVPVALLLWATLFIISSVYLGAFTPLTTAASGWRLFFKGCGLVVFTLGVILLVGAAAGAQNPLQPLKGIGGATTTPAATLKFQAVQSVADVQAALTNAQGKPVMLDIYADWCVSCKEMERYTFPDPQVQAALSPFVLLKADVTANTTEQRALLKHFGLVGPPAMLFFNNQGEEQTALRLIGFMPAQGFVARVNQVNNQAAQKL